MQVNSIISINNNKKVNFESKHNNIISKILNSKNLKTQIEQIGKKEETKEMFTDLVAIAGSFIAGITLAAEKDKEAKYLLNKIITEIGLDKDSTLNSNIQKLFENKDTMQSSSINEETKEAVVADISPLLEEYPERKSYLKITSYFPNLDKQYRILLENHAKDPNNQKNKDALYIIEDVFSYMIQPEKLSRMKPYFHALDENADVLDKIAVNVSSTIKNNESLMHYLVLLNNGKLSKDDIEFWSTVSNLSDDEFMICKSLGKEMAKSLNEIKIKYDNSFKISDFEECKSRTDDKNYMFKLDFDASVPIQKRLKIATDIHRIIYGEIAFINNKDKSSNYIEHDIQAEMVDNIMKDRRLDSTYSFVKYMNPEVLNKYDLKVSDIKFLSKNGNKYKEISRICKEALINLDINTPKMRELCEVMQDDDIFDGLLETRHARLRFISRFVLKDNADIQNLREACIEKINIFKQELKDNSDKCNYFCYTHPKGLAPQFFLNNSSLGKYIKITLNADGCIHTIYEDFNRELRDYEKAQQKQSDLLK